MNKQQLKEITFRVNVMTDKGLIKNHTLDTSDFEDTKGTNTFKTQDVLWYYANSSNGNFALLDLLGVNAIKSIELSLTKNDTIKLARGIFYASTDEYKDSVDNELADMNYPMVQNLDKEDTAYTKAFWNMVIHLIENEDAGASIVKIDKLKGVDYVTGK